jgi:glutamine phosphoribosylpyrophosphate amidotransferase
LQRANLPPTRCARQFRECAASRDIGKSTDCERFGADLLIYQDLEALKKAVRAANPTLRNFETSCFGSKYITADYLSQLAVERDESRGQGDADVLEEEKQAG